MYNFIIKGSIIKTVYISIITVLLLFSGLSASDINISYKLIKKKESKYKKFKKFFSKYDKGVIKDTIRYSADIFVPDEMISAVLNVLDNKTKTNSPKKMANDAYNIGLTTTYYYMQDISKITENTKLNDELCKPKYFIFNIDKNPKNPDLNLTKDNPNARGVTNRGVVLPINSNFPNALYPYAKKPDGCSAQELQRLYNISNDIFNDNKWFTEACNQHDICYSTLGTTYKECNSKFVVKIIDSCSNISKLDMILTFGMKNAFCGVKGLMISTIANSCAKRYFALAQKEQKAYEIWVKKYERDYLTLKD